VTDDRDDPTDSDTLALLGLTPEALVEQWDVEVDAGSAIAYLADRHRWLEAMATAVEAFEVLRSSEAGRELRRALEEARAIEVNWHDDEAAPATDAATEVIADELVGLDE